MAETHPPRFVKIYPWIFGISLWVMLGLWAGPALAAECDGEICRSVCFNGSCDSVDCKSWPGGECECSVETRMIGAVEVSICKTSGGSCSLGCDSGGVPEIPAKSLDFSSILITEEMVEALAHQGVPILEVLEVYEGPLGFVVGENTERLAMARRLRGQFLKNGRAAYERAQDVDVVLRVEKSYMAVALYFVNASLEVTGQIWNNGESGFFHFVSKNGFSSVSW